MSVVDVTVVWAAARRARPAMAELVMPTRFPNHDASEEAWSVRLRFNPPEAAQHDHATATAEFLMGDHAPEDWLTLGANFDMMDGATVAAHVAVTRV